MSLVATSGSQMDTYKRAPVEFVSGRGASLFDREGIRYLDLVAGIAVASVGHAHPAVAAAIAAQATQLIHVSNLYSTSPQAELADKLASLTGGMLSFFCNSGAEAIECALKLARRWAGPGRPRIVAAEGSFHGRTFGALSATGQPSKGAAYQPLVPGFTHVPFDDLPALDAALGDDVAAVLLEPIQGEAGVVVPDRGYLAGVRELCDRAGVLLMLDEVQTGLGRTGNWFGFQHAGIEPDVLCLAKALAGGLPMGACLAKPEVAAKFEPGDHATTFGGGPVQSAAALAVLHVIETDGLVERSSAAGGRLEAGLGRVFGQGAVRGRGLMLAVELDEPVAAEVTALALAKHVLVNSTGPQTLRFTPPLVITDDEIDRAVTILGEVWDEVSTT